MKFLKAIKPIGRVVGVVNPVAGIAVEVAMAITDKVVAKHSAVTPKVAIDDAILDTLAENNAAIVPIKSAWKSRINWLAAVPLLYAIFAFAGVPIPENIQTALEPVLVTVVPFLIVMLRSFGTTSATK